MLVLARAGLRPDLKANPAFEVNAPLQSEGATPEIVEKNCRDM